jgi:Subtilase family
MGFGLSINLSPKTKPPVATYEARDVQIPDRLEDQVIFVIQGASSDAARIAKLAKINVIETTWLDAISRTMVVAQLTPGDTVDAAILRLKRISGVTSAQPNFLFQPLGKALPKRFTLLGITSPDQARVSGTIAMIDTPITIRPEELKAGTIQQRIFGTSAAPAFHGTAIASLLIGTGEVTGMAQGAKLISLAAFDPTKSTSGISQTRYIVKAMDAAWALRPDVLNLSFGGKEDPLMAQLLTAINTRGICTVAAAGNGGPTGKVLFPATHPATLAVTAADEKLRPYAYASQGSAIDVTGIGVGLLATVPGGYRNVSGTSFATAIVSGALMRSPACTITHDPAAMRKSAAAMAQDLGAPGPDPVFGAGLFRLSAATKK